MAVLPRLLTQQAGRNAFDLGTQESITTPVMVTQLKTIFEDWAIYERFPIHQPNSLKVADDDPDLIEALRILGLIIVD